MLAETVEGILFFVFIGCVTHNIAQRCGFFKLPCYPRPPLRLTQLLSVFGIYLGFLFAVPIFLLKAFPPSSISSMVTTQFLLVLLMLATLLFYIRTEGRNSLIFTLKNPESPSSRWTDFALGMLVWFIAYPWVGAINQLCDYLLKIIFNFQSYEQVAVKYLKDNLQSPSQMIMALISIIMIAPIVEELLFRGAVQQFLKKYFSIKTSIVLTAAIFAFFHFSHSQGLGNLSLIPSLFVFACYLGYTYERQGSVFASMGLHLAFNLISSIQILFFSKN